MKAKRIYAYGFFAAILVFGLMVASCDNNNNPGDDSQGSTTRPDGDSLYDFQGFLADLPLGNLEGRWPVWNTGQPGLPPIFGGPNHLSVVNESGGGRALRVPFGGAHGVDILLTGANSVGVILGDRLEIHGRIVVIATGAAATTQLAAIRSVDGGHPNDNLVEEPITGTSPEFVIYRVIMAADFVPLAGDWRSGPSLRLVNQPSAPSTVMYVTDIRVLR